MLIGKNIALRPATADDMKLLLEWQNDPEYSGAFENHWTTSLEGIQRDHEEAIRLNQRYYLITDRATGEPLGDIGYSNRYSWADYQAQELGYVVHPRHRGRGIATQAVCVLVNHLFNATPINRIQASVVVGNNASCRVLEHAGLSHEGILRGLEFIHGRYVDLHLYAIVRADWCDEAAYRARVREF